MSSNNLHRNSNRGSKNANTNTNATRKRQKNEQNVLNMFPNVMGIVGAQGYMPNVLGTRKTSKTMKNAMGPGSLFNNTHKATIYPSHKTALSYAMRKRQWNKVMGMLDKGVPRRVLDHTNPSGYNTLVSMRRQWKDTPLVQAFHDDRLDIFTKLLDKGANPNIIVPGFSGIKGYPLIHYIFSYTNYSDENHVMPYISQLILHGADINIRGDALDRTPLDVCINREFNDIGIYLIDQGANFELPNRQGITSVLLAIHDNNQELLNEMIMKGIDVDKITIDNTQTPPWIHFPLREAVYMYVNLPILQTLLDLHPKTINTQDHDGNTPLHHVLQKSMSTRTLQAVSLLKAAGADPTIANKNGETPLGLAKSRYKNTRIYNLLKE